MENINLLRKLAWSFHKTTGLDWDDLFQEAALAYFEGLQTYDPDRGAISTHIWLIVTSRLRDYLRQEQKYEAGICPLEGLDMAYIEDTSFFQSLTKDAEEIANLVLASSNKFIGFPYERAMERIYHIMERRGWSLERTQRGIEDLQLACI